MSDLAGILGGNGSRYLAGVLACIGHVLLGILAWNGSLFALVLLTVFSVFYTGLAALNGASWRRTIRSWEHTLGGWEETQKLTSDYARLLGEACNALSTWDRETANDIVGRAMTINRLRQANLNERELEE